MKRNDQRRLVLNRETVRNLEIRELARVKGGLIGDKQSAADSCYAACPPVCNESNEGIICAITA